MTFSLTNRVALITGASRGIGAEVARTFVARGARVALVARGAEALESLTRTLGTDKAHPFPLDVTERGSLAELPARVVAHFGRLDIVVNNAGVNHRGPLRSLRAEQVAETLEANLMAPALLTYACLPHLSADGAIVNIASLAGKVPVPDEAAYSASKAGLRAFARALDMELALQGSRIRVATVCPGPVDTAFFGEDLTRVPDLVFSQPMSTVTDVAHAVLRVLDDGLQEQDVPGLSGKLATLGYLAPSLYKALRPVLERVGARHKRAHIARGGAGTR